MSFNIARKLDWNLLDEKIENFKTESGDNPYIFMNEDTIIEYILPNCLSHTVMSYCGCNVYINNKLDYGEIELR